MVPDEALDAPEPAEDGDVGELDPDLDVLATGSGGGGGAASWRLVAVGFTVARLDTGLAFGLAFGLGGGGGSVRTRVLATSGRVGLSFGFFGERTLSGGSLNVISIFLAES